MEGFEEGWKFFTEQSANMSAAISSGDYINSINQEIQKMVQDMAKFKGYSTNVDQLKGNIAEFWHADTFNIKAAVAHSTNKAHVLESNEFASVDIKLDHSSGIADYGLKFYNSSVASAKAQATSLLEAYKSSGSKDTFEKYAKDRGFDPKQANDAIYASQIRIIPSDQLMNAKQWLEQKIAKVAVTRPDQVERYKNTLAMLQDRIDDGNGVQSIPLSEQDAKTLATIAKENDIDPKDWGLTTEDLLTYQDIMRQALRAGTTAMAITVVLKVAPEIYKAIAYLIQNGEIEEGAFKKIGFAAVSGGAEGFIRGTVSAAITTCCKGGLLGSALIDIPPNVIGMATVLAMNTIKNAMKVAAHQKQGRDMVEDLVRDMYCMAGACILGGITQTILPAIPVLGYLIGSFVGSILGSFAFTLSRNIVIAFCVESGFTMFGLVDQDYTLPKSVLEEIGISTFDYETFDAESFEADTFEYDTFEADTFKPETLGFTFLRRGVIGVSKIGYICD